MITVLNVIKGKKYLMSPWKKGEVEVDIINRCGISLMSITARSHGDKIDWKEISEYAGATKSYILCDKNLRLPQKQGVKRFHSKSLTRLMSIKGAISVLSLLKTRSRKINLCFCDVCGEYKRYAPLFLPLCAQMTVMTKSDAYSTFPDYAIGEYGACAQLCDDIADASRCNFIVSPRGKELERYRGAGAVVFTSVGYATSHRLKVVSNYSWELPPKYRLLKPIFLSDEYFSQALFSIEKRGDVARISPHTFFINGNPFTAGTLASEINAQIPHKACIFGCPHT